VSRGLAKSNLGCILSGLLFHGGVVLALTALWVAGGLPYGGYRLRAAERAWADGFLTESQYEASYPVRAADATARRLDHEARRMGTYLIYTFPDGVAGSPDTLKPARDYWSALRKEEDGPVRVPPELARLVEERGEALRAIEAELAANPSVAWRFGTGDGSLGLLGVRNVNALLVLRGMIAEQRNSPADRERSLEASWRLSESIRSSPIMIDRFLVQVTAGDRNACLRRLRVPNEGWTERLRMPGRLARAAETYQAEARTYCRGAGGRLLGAADLDALEGGEVPRVSPGRWIIRLLSAPYVRLSVAGYSDTLRMAAGRMRETNPCGVTPDAFVDGAMAGNPPWNIVSKVAAPSVLRSWFAFRDGVLDDELTAAPWRLEGDRLAHGPRACAPGCTGW
jgi:hypothetical protein